MPQTPLTLQRLGRLLASERSLAVLLPQARRLAELNRLFARAVPAGVARVCRVAALQGDSVVVYCAHGAAAARLRSQARSLAEALSASGEAVHEVKVKVRADWVMPDRPAKPGMTTAALTAWSDLAASLPAGDLKTAVARLLRHQRRG